MVELPEDDPAIVKKFLQFMYTGTYDDDEHPAGSASSASMKTAEEIEMELEHEQGAICDDKFTAGGHENSTESAEAASGSEFEDRSVEVTMPDVGRTSENELYEPYSVPLGSYTEVQEEIEGPDAENIDTMTDADLECYNPRTDGLEEDELDSLNEDKSTSKTAKAPYERSLMTAVAVYLMADKFDVPALRLFARERFYRSAQACLLSHPDLCDIIDEIYTMTRDTDDGIRAIPARLIGAEYIYDPGLRAKIQPVLFKHGEFATRMFHYVLYATTKAGLGIHPTLTFPRRKKKVSKMFPKQLRPLQRRKSRGGPLRVSEGYKVLHDS